MANYINSTCPVCGNKFKEDDDIVVCPECGTPHHRSCYKEIGKCANSPKHGVYVWESSLKQESTVKKTEETRAFTDIFFDDRTNDSKKCPVCGSENTSGNRYCSKCGAPFSENSDNNGYQKVRYDSFSSANFNGATSEEIIQAVGRNSSMYFLTRFKYFSEGHKISPNIFAFFFSYFYLFYRKMYNVGISVFLAVNILGLPASLLSFQTLQEYYVEQGLLSQILVNIPHIETLEIYADIGNILVWIIRLALLLYFNYMYYFKVTATIKGIKAGLKEAGIENDKERFTIILKKKCGTSMTLPVIIVLLLLALSFVLAFAIVLSPYFTYKI